MLSFDNHYVSFNYHPETDLRNQEVKFGKKKHLTKLGEYYEGIT